MMATGRGGNRGEQHSALVASCTQYLKWQHAWVAKLMGGLGQKPGLPDLIAVKDGILICVECKTGLAELSMVQEREREALIEHGAIYVVARSVDDLEEAMVARGLGQRLLVPAGQRE